MGIFEKFASRPKPPGNYVPVDFKFTPEESEAIHRNRKMYATIFNEDAPDGTEAVVPQKFIDAISAQGLTEYAASLMLDLARGTGSDTTAIMDKAINAMMKAYAIHNLPIYLFQIAGLFELIGAGDDAKKFFRLFLKEQREFTPDQVESIFINRSGFDVPGAISIAESKL